MFQTEDCSTRGEEAKQAGKGGGLQLLGCMWMDSNQRFRFHQESYTKFGLNLMKPLCFEDFEDVIHPTMWRC